jgi:hypothetical protein
MGRRTYGQTDGQMVGRIDGRMLGYIDGRTDGLSQGFVSIVFMKLPNLFFRLTPDLKAASVQAFRVLQKKTGWGHLTSGNSSNRTK